MALVKNSYLSQAAPWGDRESEGGLPSIRQVKIGTWEPPPQSIPIHGMGAIKILKIGRLMQGKVRVEIEVRTSVGRMIFPVDVDDQGSLAKTEHAAFEELQELLEESLSLVQQKLE